MDLDPRLSPAFFDRDPVAIARDLLGRLLVRREDGEVRAAARIVETEGYDCPRDPSCFVIDRLPGAAEALRGPPGRFYFHRSYEHRLLNVVCGPEGYPATVLVRAVEPVFGLDWMRAHRPVRRPLDLANGPAKLVAALHLEARFAGEPVDHPDAHFAPGDPVADDEVEVTTRVGLRRGADLPWRFLLGGNPWVSPGRPSA